VWAAERFWPKSPRNLYHQTLPDFRQFALETFCRPDP
jgi:hypothetical protein